MQGNDEPKGEIVVVMGYPAMGKSTRAQQYVEKGYVRLDQNQGENNLDQAVLKAKELHAQGYRRFVFDNSYGTKKSRSQVLKWAKSSRIPVNCDWIVAPKNREHEIEDIEIAQYNAVKRMIEMYGQILTNIEMKTIDDPKIFPAAILYSYRASFEEPSLEEGFASVREIEFAREMDADVYQNKAIILEYDGTLRKCKSGAKFPSDPDDIAILPGRREVLKKYEELGYYLLGASNQPALGEGDLSESEVVNCFESTNELLGVKIDYYFCPHNGFPINCYCHKPMPGLGVLLIEEYKLDPSKCIAIGCQTSDKTFARRCGFQFIDANSFFSG